MIPPFPSLVSARTIDVFSSPLLLSSELPPPCSTTFSYVLFNPDNVSYRKNNWSDQVYINSIKHNLKYKKLDLNLFPNGKYYMNKQL